MDTTVSLSEVVDEHRRLAEDGDVLESHYWLKLPDKFQIHEWKILNDFGQSLSDAGLRDEIARAIRGSGAFRKFKTVVRNRGIEQSWCDFRTQALRDIARDWLETHGLEVDDSPPIYKDA